MAKKTKKSSPVIYWILPAVLGAVALLVGVQYFSGPSGSGGPEAVSRSERSDSGAEATADLSPAADRTEPDAKAGARGGSASLQEVIARRVPTWQPAFQRWTGEDAPDFVMKDIAGNQHSISDYRGKTVMVIFWATWCPPCLEEVPDLIKLRRQMSKDELAMLAISPEDAGLVRSFANLNDINYTVITAAGTRLPEPFSYVRAIPSTFFIDATGKIRLAAEGAITAGDLRAILKAIEVDNQPAKDGE